MTHAREALDALFERWAATLPSGLPRVEHDPEWPSPCEVGAVGEDGTIAWRALPRTVEADLGPLERAYGGPLPESARALLGSRYFGVIESSIDLDGERVPVLLRSVWNDEELDSRVREACESLARTAPSEHARILIGNTYDDRFWSLSLVDGAVRLEDPGRAPSFAAASLEGFLERLSR